MAIRKDQAFILDDDPVFNRMITAVLRKFGISSRTFLNQADLHAWLAEETPRLLLLDLNLEGEHDGFQVLRHIRENPANNFPVVIVSGEQDRAAIAHALEIGATDYLVKPLNRDVLTSRLQRHFESLELQAAAMGSEADVGLDCETKLAFDIDVLAIEEGRIRFQCPHLIAKGTVFSASGPLIGELTGGREHLLLTVCRTSVKDDRFVVEAEPDLTDPELMRNLRTWIARNSAKNSES